MVEIDVIVVDLQRIIRARLGPWRITVMVLMMENLTHLLFYGGQKMTLARFPNKNQVMSWMKWPSDPDWEYTTKMKGQISYHEILEKSAGSNGGIKFNLHTTLQSRVADWSHHKNSTKDKIWLDGVYNLSWEWEYNQVETIKMEILL